MVDYYLIRAHGNILLMDQLDVIGRTSELARLFGIQFYEVLTRGSQFRVESIMLRLVKARNYIPISSSVQVGLWKITYHPIAKKSDILKDKKLLVFEKTFLIRLGIILTNHFLFRQTATRQNASTRVPSACHGTGVQILFRPGRCLRFSGLIPYFICYGLCPNYCYGSSVQALNVFLKITVLSLLSSMSNL